MTFKEELEIILEKELTVLMSLKEISFEKTDMIINHQIQDLEKTTKKEEDLINEMALLEESRERLLDTWGVAIDTPISDVIERVPEDNKGLIDLKDKMTLAFEELYVRNTLNNDLIRENLDWIDFNMNLITNSSNNPSYGLNNKKTSGNSIFDRKV
ncbi:flagellar protein FlgN [Tissierella sp.]|uniref:flagellar protein FlgN n=1 Tax=Tissierella sp. TaxID=41274 RepID=UPI00285FD4AA|nr:flagellar protein FlgN [Tissierella sp.]MDR7856924.1 flagellar protein FlgN [Tissierella sp.]